MPKLPEKCPICGERVEKGIVRAEGSGGTIVRWFKTSEISNLRGGERLKFGFLKADFDGVRCTSCKTVVLSYSQEMKKP